MTEWEERANYWKNSYYNLESAHDKLKRANDSVASKLTSAEYKINTQLKPRIKQEEKAYDSFVTGGGGNACFQEGLNGNCGFNCSGFGSEDECQIIFESITDKELLTAYDEGIESLVDEIESRGLQVKMYLIDIALYKSKIKNQKIAIKNSIKIMTKYMLKCVKYWIRDKWLATKNKLKGGK